MEEGSARNPFTNSCGKLLVEPSKLKAKINAVLITFSSSGLSGCDFNSQVKETTSGESAPSRLRQSFKRSGSKSIGKLDSIFSFLAKHAFTLDENKPMSLLIRWFIVTKLRGKKEKKKKKEKVKVEKKRSFTQSKRKLIKRYERIFSAFHFSLDFHSSNLTKVIFNKWVFADKFHFLLFLLFI